MRFNLYILLFLFIGCSSQKGIETVTTTRVNWVNRDSIVIIAPRSAEARAALNITNGNITLGKTEQVQKQTGITPIVKVVDNYVYVECKVDSMKVYLSWKEKHETTQVTKTISIKEKQPFIERHPYISIFIVVFISLMIMIGYNKLSGFFKMFI